MRRRGYVRSSFLLLILFAVLSAILLFAAPSPSSAASAPPSAAPPSAALPEAAPPAAGSSRSSRSTTPPAPPADPSVSPAISASPSPDLPATESAPPPTLEKEITIEEAVSLTLQYSPLIREAIAEVDEAMGTEREVRGESRLSLTGHGFLSRGNTVTMIPSFPMVRPEAMVMPPAGSNAFGSLVLSLPLYTGQRIEAAARAARFSRMAREEIYSSVRVNLAYEAREAFLQALLSRDLVGVHQEILQENEELLRITRVRFEKGKAAKFLLFRAEAELQMARQQLIQASNQEAISITTLKKVLGIDMTSKITLPPTPGETETEDPVEGSASEEKNQSENFNLLIAQALENRPDLRAAAKEVSRAMEEVKSARGEQSPQIGLYGRLDGFTTPGTGTFSGNTISLVTSFPILDGGVRKGKIQQAKARLEKSKAMQALLSRDVVKEVTQAWLDLQSAAEQLDAARKGEEAAREDLRIARIRFEAGKGIHLEILDALSAFARSRFSRIEAGYMVKLAGAKLLQARGKISSP